MTTSDRANETLKTPCRRLRIGDVVRFDRVCSSMKIECREGVLWITQTDLGADIILSAGQIFEPRSAGRVVVQALAPACFTKTCNN